MKQITIINNGIANTVDLPEKYYIQRSSEGVLFREGEKPNINRQEGREQAEKAQVIAKIAPNDSYVITNKNSLS